MKYPVNLTLLTALGLLRGDPTQHVIHENMLVVFNGNETVPPVFCCTNSYTMAIGVDSAEITRPAQLVKLWAKLEQSPDSMALVSLADLDAINKLTPKGKNEKAAYLSTIMLETEADRDQQRAYLTSERFSGRGVEYGNFPKASNLLYLNEDKTAEGVSLSGALLHPLPTMDVAFDPDVLGKVLKIAKMFDSVVRFHGRGGAREGEWGRARHYWSIREESVLIVGVIMPVNSPNREWVEVDGVK